MAFKEKKKKMDSRVSEAPIKSNPKNSGIRKGPALNVLALRRKVQNYRKLRNKLAEDLNLYLGSRKEKFATIEKYQREYPLGVLIKALEVTRSGYYAWKKRPLSERKVRTLRILNRIKKIHKQSEGKIGSPGVHKKLRDEGLKCGHNKVATLMRENGIYASRGRMKK